MSKKKKAVKPDDIRAEIDGLRGEIESLKLQRAELDEAWLPISVATDRARAMVDTLAARFAEANLPYRLNSILRADGPIHATMLFRADEKEIGPLLCFLIGDAIKARLAEVVQNMNYEPGAPLAERAKARQSLEKQLFDLEAQEEKLIVQAEAEGLEVLRHPDARPEVVLELESAA